jgi:hypothetical protein
MNPRFSLIGVQEAQEAAGDGPSGLNIPIGKPQHERHPVQGEIPGNRNVNEKGRPVLCCRRPGSYFAEEDRIDYPRCLLRAGVKICQQNPPCGGPFR